MGRNRACGSSIPAEGVEVKYKKRAVQHPKREQVKQSREKAIKFARMMITEIILQLRRLLRPPRRVELAPASRQSILSDFFTITLSLTFVKVKGPDDGRNHRRTCNRRFDKFDWRSIVATQIKAKIQQVLKTTSPSAPRP